MLSTVSNFVGRSIGSSAGLAPRRSLPASTPTNLQGLITALPNGGRCGGGRTVLPLRAVVARTNCREGASAILGSHTATGSERVRPAELFHATATATLGSKGCRIAPTSHSAARRAARMISSMIGRTLAANWRAFAFRAATPRFAALGKFGLPRRFPRRLAAARAAFVRAEIIPAPSSATAAICCKRNLPVAPSIIGRSANRTSTPASTGKQHSWSIYRGPKFNTKKN
jgi:hypothetical protein